MKHTLDLHRKYISLQNKPIPDMMDYELRVIITETPSFNELEQAENELKRRGKLKITSLEAFANITGGKIIID